MAKEEAYLAQGKVTQALANTQFRVKLDNGLEVICHIAGRMRKHFIRILPGDIVTVAISPYDSPRAASPSAVRCARRKKKASTPS